ncbi:hypothetical protein FOXYSP1_00730 [Fusarium oxysporum f. sp. phaseoli]
MDVRLAHSERKEKKVEETPGTLQEPHDTQAFSAVLAHQNAAWTPVRGAPAVSGPPMEDKLLPMWRRPLAVGCTTTLLGVLGTTSVDALLFCWQQLAALRQAACSVPVCVWLALPAYRYPSSSPIWCGPKHMYYVWTGPSLSRPSVEIHRVRLSTFFSPSTICDG